ncbi:oxidoreductase, short chain dehydrogenase/reductase family protein [marine gamma proteobacterium HTCC2143]|jgi:NAD(P)-dependent dehydrogenase (short-subunit alcohol dehydrogenase family)|uniref:Oxidoreductase, short chain dehydrogenase/reductase family protein n=1 Tax=marine gamma proteobacterium HTCC2143 TaxID=247633 RepID=A0YHH1_9GAMM|nr:oxidoreductase, short chain dehydrogenase/reductase family protein [marine gamma proteobacterium HTCC2143]
MQVKDRIIVVTGAASGIGKAMAQRFHKEGAKLVVCADYNGDGVRAVAEDVDGISFEVNVAVEADIQTLIETVESEHGPIDLFCSNAGISVAGGVEVDNDDWQRIWDINLMAHVWAARHLVPKMLARGGGYLLNTASAAGLLSQIGSAPYAVTKHAAVSLAEWLSITYGDQGLKVSVLCPQAVRTAMTAGHEDAVASVDGMMDPDDVAEACMQTIEAEKFLVLPHPEVMEYMRRKTSDYDRWLGGMQRLNALYTKE